MCEYLGYEVTKLKRTRIMNVKLDNLKPGKWRNLTEKEMSEINLAVSSSSKTAVDTAQPVEQRAERPRKPTSNSGPKKIFVNKKHQASDDKKTNGKRTLKLKRK